MLQESRQQWWEKEISKLERAPQNEKWKILNRFTDHGFHMAVQQVKVGGKFVFQDGEILTEMEKVHVSKVSSDKPLMDHDIIQNWFEQAKQEIDTHESDLEITREEVARTFETCTNTQGPDGVTAMMIDKADRSLMNRLHRLWSKISQSSELPSKWKLEHTILLPKPGKETYHECSSYRTISVTDMLGKRLERIIAARLVCQLEEEGFDEFAYLKRRSSTQAVLSLVEAVKSNMLQGVWV